MKNLGTKNNQSDIPTMDDVDRAYIVYQEYAPYTSGVTTTGAVLVYTGSSVQAGMFTTANNVQNKPTFGYQQTPASATAVARISGTQAAIPMRFPTLYQSSGLVPSLMAHIATHRFALGIANIPWYTDVNPSTNVNCIFIGYDSEDATVKIMHNDSAGTCTKIDTGWVKPTAANQYHFALELKSNPSAGTVSYKARRWKNTDFKEDVLIGTISTDLPYNTVAMCFFTTVSVGGTSSVAHVQMGRTVLKSWI